ncbi:MAG: hypothetical protein HY298_09675 [Verrucomicrobia bacterium]|nr:hypothetical protein [Verrucomicrobiota bacterium]
MAQPDRTQKQVAERYKGNLDYYKKPHYLRRGKFWVVTILVTLGVASMCAYHWWGGEKFYSSGSISRPHAHFANNCGACHAGGSLLQEIKSSSRNAIDTACLQCHQGHAFHQPNVVQDHSCTACHHEHKGQGPMKSPDNANCLVCHADTAILEASFQKGKNLPAEAFDYRPSHGLALFKSPRPSRGHTQVVHAFATDHPEFQVVVEKLKDPDTLKFNHQLHLASPDIPSVNGKKLDCADCHQPNAAGVFHQRISFEANCKSCHSLQFDAKNPELLIPHGNPEFVRAFLRSLPVQYADLARRKGMNAEGDVADFVKRQMLQIRDEVLSGENLEQQVFFSDARTGPVGRIGRLDDQGRARFAGCAYCHEVKPVAESSPTITKPIIPDRWLIRGRFNHAKHLTVGCVKCHDVSHSRETSDILLPSKAACVTCHSPQGGVAHDCSTCHRYHAQSKTGVPPVPLGKETAATHFGR